MRFLASKKAEIAFKVISILIVSVAILVLAALILNITIAGASRISLDFFTNFPSRHAEKAGIASALVGSLYLMILTGAFSLPLGVGAAIYLEEYATKNKFSRFIELNIANLAGVPSIIYGILGLQVFVRYLSLERSLLAGALTMSLLILPVIIIASREAIRRVPDSIRQAAFALGATKWEVIRDQVIPASISGILTGCILAFSRAVGETAPLITLGALTYVAFIPDSIFSSFTALPIQAFNWISRPQTSFHANAAGAILVLLIVLLCLNLIAIILRAKFQKRLT
ncbi:MAG: phosphate ABC transporter permease PstA [Bdellovibrionales bacterium]|nr:phosphate ABC transporter permease PstA [Bdellovibrionales bacterium]